MTSEATYLNCRRALGVAFGDVWRKARERTIDIACIETCFEEQLSRDEAIYALHSCGMSLTDIASVLELTRERIRQIIAVQQGDEQRSKTESRRRNQKRLDPESLRRALCENSEYWGDLGRLKVSAVIEHFSGWGYSEADVHAALDKLQIDRVNGKACLLLTHWLNLPEDEHKSYFGDRLRRITQSQLLDGLNKEKPVQLSIMAFNRYMRSLGIASSPSGGGVRRSYGTDDEDWGWLKREAGRRT